ncbi:MAG: hypothetical protein M3N30_14045 [Bacteroidota bacterium]|nr:hypothetical protein [Bacteroidota bacterium]
MSRIFFYILLSLLIISFAPASQAQIVISNYTFDDGMQKIRVENKLLMVIMDAEEGGSSINDYTSKAILDSDASDLNKIAIIIRPALGSADWDSINRRYFTPYTFGTLFFNPKGVLVHRYDAINEHGSAYLVEANHAYADINLPTAQEQLDSLNKIHFSDFVAVKKLFDTRTNSVESTDDLTEPFIENTPLDSFDTYPFYYMLAKLAPTLGTRADSIFRSVKNIDSNWYRIPSSERVDINHRIIKKTMNAAVSNKDVSLASRLAQFSSNTLTNPTEFRIQKEQYRIMTDFFYKVHDTVLYLKTASVFVNDYYMTLSIDSLKQVYIKKEKERNDNDGTKTIYVNGASPDNMAYYGEFSLIASILNHHAWEFYIEARDTAYLRMALVWSKRSLEFNKSPYAMDTYAQLLYASGDRKDAISAEKDALREYRKQNLNSKIPKIEKVLENMKNNLDVVLVE